MTKKIALEFTEGPVESQHELTEADAAKFGVKLSEIDAVDLGKIKEQMKENYMLLGLSESEAQLAADLDLGSKIY